MRPFGRTVFSIGHSTLPLGRFFDLLESHGVQIIVDTRSQPASRFAPQFNRRTVEAEAKVRGLTYVFAGESLGGRPQEREFYDTEGRVLYGRVARSSRFLEAIAGLQKLVEEGKVVAILCAEEDPSSCHRRLLIGRVLAQRAIEMKHIRKGGQIEADKRLQREVQGEREFQGSLFGQENEDADWKSTRSVSPREVPPNSLVP